MPIYGQTLLLFALNFLDALLTLYWVRNGFATESNHLMASLLDVGDLPFLLVKVSIGAVTAAVLWRWRSFRLAKYGLGISLFIYVGLMGVHFFTGLSALGLLSQNLLHDVAVWGTAWFALFI